MSNKSKEVEIILTEYKSLRQEILQKMDACWKILTFETGGTSLVFGYVFANKEYRLLLIIPFLILVSSFLHLSETSTIINAGNYIRDNIEKDLKKLLRGKEHEYKSMSWESFVEEEEGVDPYKYVHISTVCLFIGMFWISIFLSIGFKEEMGIPPPVYWPFHLLLLGYSIAFIVYMYVWVERILRKL